MIDSKPLVPDRTRLFITSVFRLLEDVIFVGLGVLLAGTALYVLTAAAISFRPHNRDGRILGLYLVGAGTHPGAGVPGVINSAKATVGLIERDFRLKP